MASNGSFITKPRGASSSQWEYNVAHCSSVAKNRAAAIADLQWFFRDAESLHTQSAARFQRTARPSCCVVKLLRSTKNAEPTPLGKLSRCSFVAQNNLPLLLHRPHS